MPRNIVIAIDVEPDPIKSGSDETWEGTAVTLRELSALGKRVQEQTGAAFRLNWFSRFDRKMERAWGPDWVPQAWLLNTANSNGDFIGVQVHLWKWQEDRGWYNEVDNPSWRSECLNSAIEGYRGLLGESPSASRFADHQLFADDIQPLRESQIHYDLTLEPRLPADGGPLKEENCQAIPRKPFRPSPDDYLRPLVIPPALPPERDLWLVPLAVTKNAQWRRVKRPPFFMRTKAALSLVLRPREAWAQLSQEMNRDTPEPLVLSLRSGDLADPFLLGNFRLLLENLAQSPRLVNARFVSIDRAIAAYVKGVNGTPG